MRYILLSLFFFFIFSSLSSHSGRTNSEGCHRKTSNNTYHCHNAKSKPKTNAYTKSLEIIDGDTIRLNGSKIRFSGIDAPESYFRGKKQFCFIGQTKVDCAKLSTNFLKKSIGNATVKCKLEKKPDQYNRSLGECFINNQSLSKILVKNGYAFDYPKYSKKKYSKEQDYARVNKLGIWNMKFEFPWEFRDRIRSK